MTETAFQRTKEDALSGKALKDIRALIEQEMPGYSVQKQGRVITTRVLEALRSTSDWDDADLADKIESCGRGRLCGSVYCVDCRNRAASELNKRISRHVHGRFDDDADEARQHLRYVTVLCELTDFNLADVKQSIANARQDIKAMKRRFSNIWVQGSFEFELIDMKLLGKSGAVIKQDTLAAMMNMSVKDSQSLGQRVIVHFHALVDLNGTDGSEFRRWVRNRWHAHGKQTEVKCTNKGQTLTNMAKKISSYGFKNRVQYNLSFLTNGYKKGVWFKNEHLGMLVGIYDRIDGRGYKGWLIGRG